MSLYAKEEWPVYKAQTEIIYCGVLANVVSVTNTRGVRREVLIVIPSEVFNLMHQVWEVQRESLVESPASFYLEQDSSKWYFGLLHKDLGHKDLWAYEALPAWAIDV